MNAPAEFYLDEFRATDITDDAIAVLAAITSLNLYVRAGQLVHVVDEPVYTRDGDSPLSYVPRIREARKGYIRELLAQHITWYRYDKREMDYVVRFVPDWVVDAVMARDAWPGIRPLSGVVTSPVLRPDGTVVEEPGYDSATGVIYRPDRAYPTVPTVPTLGDAQRAMEALLDPIVDFPFAAPTHKFGVIAAILTLLGRYSFAGPSPLVAVSKNVRGAGGSRLVDIIVSIGCGGVPARMAYTGDDDEMRKRVLAIALAGERAVALDNVATTVGGAALEMALTTACVADRILGKSEQVTAALDCVWFVNGNGLAFSSDALRRTLLIELASPDEQPERRSGFRYPDLMTHIRQSRPQLVVAGLTLLRAWHVAGMPTQGLRPWGSFEEWSHIRDVIVWAGGVDPAQGREAAEAALDTEAASLGTLLSAWPTLAGPSGRLTSRALVERVWGDGDASIDPVREAVREALAELCPTDRERPTPRALGQALGRCKGRVVDGRKLVASRPKNSGILWSVEAT